MANAQVLLLVAGSAIPAATLRALVATAGQLSGFSEGPWTSASGISTAVRETPSSGAAGVFSEGPWLGMSFTPNSPVAPVPTRWEWTAIRMNLLGGPDTDDPDDPASALHALGNRILAGAAMIPGFEWVRLASRRPQSVISWDRGVPAPLALPESSGAGSSSAGSGLLLGLGAVAALAWFARSAR